MLLILPSASYRAPDFMAAADALGVEVVVASDRRAALSGAMGDRALTLRLHRPQEAAEAIATLHARTPLDGIVAVDDQGVHAAALASARLGLRGNPPGAVAATRDKAALRRALAAAGVSQPDFALLAPGDDPGTLGFPVVIKPLSLSASRGVIRADNSDAAHAAAARARAILEDPGAPLLAERYVPGAEVAVEGLLRDGKLEVLAIFDKPDPLEGPYFEETLYVTPSRLPPAPHAEVERLTAAAAQAVGLVEGPIHAELRVDGDRVWVVELAARSIGGLCARALRFGAGISLEELILRHALGLALDELGRERAASGVLMLPIPRAGTLREVGGQERARAVPGVVGLEVSIAPGRPVRPLPEGDRYLGFVFARADTPAEVEAALRAAHAELEVEIEERLPVAAAS